MLHEWCLCGEDVKAFRRGEGTTNDDSIALIDNPASFRVEMCSVVAVLIESENGNEVYAGLRDIQDVS